MEEEQEITEEDFQQAESALDLLADGFEMVGDSDVEIVFDMGFLDGGADAMQDEAALDVMPDGASVYRAPVLRRPQLSREMIFITPLEPAGSLIRARWDPLSREDGFREFQDVFSFTFFCRPTPNWPRFTNNQLHVLTSVPLLHLVMAQPGPQKELGVRTMARLLFEESSLPPENSERMIHLEAEAERVCRSNRMICSTEQRQEGWNQARVLMRYWERLIWEGDKSGWKKWKKDRPQLRIFRPPE